MKITYKEMHKLLDEGVKLSVNTPNGVLAIKNKFIKEDTGYIIKYDDGTQTKCACTHYMHFNNELRNVRDIFIGDWDSNSHKIVTEILDVPTQLWYDIEIEHESGLYYQNGIIHHNSGKSLTIAMLADFFRTKNKKGLLVVPNINLLTQFKNDIKDYNLMNLYNNTFTIGGGQTIRDFSHAFTISTWQSLMDSKDSMKEFDYVMIDETHRASGIQLSDMIQKSTNAQYKLGFTGTLNDNEIDRTTLYGLFGKPKTYIRTQGLIELGLATPVEINAVQLLYGSQDKALFRGAKGYHKQLQFIKEHKNRNLFIASLAEKISQDGNTLVLFQHTAHGKELFLQAMKKLHPNIDVQNKDITGKKAFEFQRKYGVYFINGEVDGKIREKVRLILEESKKIKITLDDDTIFRLHPEDEVKLSNSSTKLAKNLTTDDDIADDFIEYKRQLYK